MCPLGFEPVTYGIKAPIQYGYILNKNQGEKFGKMSKKVGPAGFEPATWRITAQFLVGYILRFNY